MHAYTDALAVERVRYRWILLAALAGFVPVLSFCPPNAGLFPVAWQAAHIGFYALFFWAFAIGGIGALAAGLMIIGAGTLVLLIDLALLWIIAGALSTAICKLQPRTLRIILVLGALIILAGASTMDIYGGPLPGGGFFADWKHWVNLKVLIQSCIR